MKGNYTKPLFNVEFFSLTQSVVRDCGSSVPGDEWNGGDPSTCGWVVGDDTVLFVFGNNCSVDGEDMGFGCYNNPSEGNYIFRS